MQIVWGLVLKYTLKIQIEMAYMYRPYLINVNPVYENVAKAVRNMADIFITTSNQIIRFCN